MAECCVICTCEFTDATSVLKCGHKFCSECIIGNIAINTGTQEGTSRNLCPLCREPLCQEVLPSAKYTIRIEDLEGEVKKLRKKLITSDKQKKKIFSRNEDFVAENHGLTINVIELQDKLRFAQFKSDRRADTIRRVRVDVLNMKKYLCKNYEHCPQVTKMMELLDKAMICSNTGKTDKEAPTLDSGDRRCEGCPNCGDSPEEPRDVIHGFMTIIPNSPEELSSLSIHNLKAWTSYIKLDDSACLDKSDLVNLIFTSKHHILARQAFVKNQNEIRIGKCVHNYFCQRYRTPQRVVDMGLEYRYINGKKHFVLMPQELNRLIGTIISDIFSFYSLVRKYPGETVSMQRDRLKKVLELRDARYLVGPNKKPSNCWVAEKMSKFSCLDIDPTYTHPTPEISST